MNGWWSGWVVGWVMGWIFTCSAVGFIHWLEERRDG